MIYLKRHFAKLFTLDNSGFCWIYDPTVIYALSLTFNGSLTDRLFYTIKSKGFFMDTKFPVIDTFILFGKKNI